MDNVSPVFKEMVFVFGSNTLGVHGKGAAQFACKHFGAPRGRGEGYVESVIGKSYAIPTKTGRRNPWSLVTRSLPEIRESVARFLEFAANNQDKQFFVTAVGTKLAGYSDAEISELFAEEMNIQLTLFSGLHPWQHCWFPEGWSLPTQVPRFRTTIDLLRPVFLASI